MEVAIPWPRGAGLALVVAVACGDDDEDEGDASAAITLDQPMEFAERVAIWERRADEGSIKVECTIPMTAS